MTKSTRPLPLPLPLPMTTIFKTFMTLIALASSLAGCDTQPVNTNIRQGGYSLALPRGFVDDTAYFIQSHELDQDTIAVNASHGYHLQPVLQFNSEWPHRTQGGCMLAQLRLTDMNPDRWLDTESLVHHAAQAFNSPKLEFQPLRPISPLRPLQNAQLQDSRPVDMAGLSGWQETWRVHWARQAGPTQPTSLLTVMSADVANPRSPGSDRTSLVAACFVMDLEEYLGTAMSDVLAVMNTLKASP